LEKDVKDIIKIIGHDGSERWFNGLFPWRGFHVQELIDVCFHLGYTASIIEKTPTSASLYDDKEVFLPVAITRFQKYLEKFDGLLYGHGAICHHWVAWKGQKIICPSKKDTAHFIPEFFLLISKIKDFD
jgi:hypothetical protein